MVYISLMRGWVAERRLRNLKEADDFVKNDEGFGGDGRLVYISL